MRVTPKRTLATLVLLLLGGIAAIALALALVERPRSRAEIHAWLPDGTVTRVSPAEGIYYQACVHPDGTSVVFSGGSKGPHRVFLAPLPDGDVVPLTPADSAAFQASYSWDGGRIVFSSDRAIEGPSIPIETLEDPRYPTDGETQRNSNLYVMDADGGNVRQITKGPYRDLRASFSPDGQRVVFFSNRQPWGPLWTAAADGSGEPERIRLEGGGYWYLYRPWFTPDGRHVYAFGWKFRAPKKRRIYRVPTSGGVPEKLAWDDRGKTQGPFVDPSGRSLLLHNNRTGRARLWEIPLTDDGEPRMLKPPGLAAPEERSVMHPTRSRTGVIAFDVNYEVGGGPRWLQRLRRWLAGS